MRTPRYSLILLCTVLSAASSQAQTERPLPDTTATLERRIAVLELEVQKLKAELAELRAVARSPGAAPQTTGADAVAQPGAGAPTQAELEACFKATPSQRDMAGKVTRLEFGTAIPIEGEMLLRMNAPKGARLFPVKVYFGEDMRLVRAYRDSFGGWQC